ncbi:MAG: hypothetical protein ACLFUH_04590 [Bacteroidales bacterium]
MVRQISVYVDDWHYDELKKSENKSETVREALEQYFKNQKEENNMQELIKKLAETGVTRFYVKEFRKIAEDNTVFEELMEWFDTEFVEKYDFEIEPGHLIELKCDEKGLTYYYGRAPEYLDAPVGDEKWSERQWTEEALRKLLKGIQKEGV